MNNNLDPMTILYMIVTLIVSLVVHETMHAYVGLKLGDNTARGAGRISLNPLQHIDPFMTLVLPVITLILFGVPVLAAKPVPVDSHNLKWDEFGMAIVALAGPLSNLVLAVIGAALFRLIAVPGMATDFLTVFVALNIAIFVFNLIPIPPLDGSRVLYAFAPESVQKLMLSIEQFGIFLVFALIIGFSQFAAIIGNIQESITRFLL